MWETLRNAWKIADLRKKILYTLFMLLIYRLQMCIIDRDMVGHKFGEFAPTRTFRGHAGEKASARK